MRIYRYPLGIVDYQVIDLPQETTVLSVAPSRIHSYNIDMWALVDETATTTTPNNVYIVGTGNLVPKALLEETVVYIGTAVMPNQYVWHVFLGGNTDA